MHENPQEQPAAELLIEQQAIIAEEEAKQRAIAEQLAADKK